jgi:hypothetical protein
VSLTAGDGSRLRGLAHCAAHAVLDVIVLVANFLGFPRIVWTAVSLICKRWCADSSRRPSALSLIRTVAVSPLVVTCTSFARPRPRASTVTVWGALVLEPAKLPSPLSTAVTACFPAPL